SWSLIPTLQVPPLMGRNFTEAEDLPKGPWLVLISESLWRNRFGADPKILERHIDVNGRSRQILCLMPERFRFPHTGTQVGRPIQLDPKAEFGGGFNYTGIARLRPGVTATDAQRDFTAVLPRAAELFPNLAPGVPMKMLLEQAKPKPLIIPLRDD